MRIALGLALLGAACIYACGSSSSSPKGGSAGAGIGAAGDSSNGSAGKSSGSSGNGASSGDAGEGGEGGSATVPVVVSTGTPHAAGGIVAGGIVAHSKHFTGVFSLGAAPGGNRISTSSKYQLRGGVLGASQK